MKLVIGLGNPDKKYERTRHNIGFMMADKLREIFRFPDFAYEKKFNAEISRGKNESTGGKDAILAKPQTFMNESGQAVRAIMDYYRISSDKLVVIQDEIDIEIGKFKISTGSGAAGHRGIEDIVEKLDTREFTRIRIGVANPDIRTKIKPGDFVLQKFSDEEAKMIENIFPEIIEEIGKILKTQ